MAPLATSVIRRQMLDFAQRFIFGRDAAAALPKLRALRERRLGFTLDVLGEASVGEGEAVDYQQRYLELLDGLRQEAASWRPDPLIDRAAWGAVPRVNISIKITSLFSQIDPLDFRGSVEAVKDRLRPIFRKAQQTGAFVNLDLEQFRYRDLTFAIFKELLDEEEFASYDEAGVVVQAYLRDAENDIRGLIDWARERGRVITVRLVKGAYWDYETVQAAQEGWPAPVFTHKPDSDVMYERITRLMLEHPAQIRSAFASHNVRSLANAIATAEALGLPRDAYELQMLHGMGEPIKAAVKKLGLRLREYAPVGELIPGMAYFVRRLLENTANESFLRLTFAEGEDQDRLVRAPRPSPDVDRRRSDCRGRPRPTRRIRACSSISRTPISPGPRTARRSRPPSSACAPVRPPPAWASTGRCGSAARPSTRLSVLTSVDPARPQQVVGTAAYAGPDEAERAVAAARAAFAAWSETPPAERAAVLFRAAELMRAELFELAALEVLEAGKTWREADADVGEADRLPGVLRPRDPAHAGRGRARRAGRRRRRHAAPARRRARRRALELPARDPHRHDERGAGRRRSRHRQARRPDAGHRRPAGAHPARRRGAARHGQLPALARGTVGEFLVRHPDVEVIAFTGSKDVGLHIIEEAAAHPSRRGLKRVIAEMGGKNALIVDSDADLDVAVLEGLVSAFHFQGQKCSAASRIIVLEGAYDEFVKRFADAARSVVVGPPDDPANRMGPVITAEARATIEGYIKQGMHEGRPVLVTEPPAGGWPEGGFYVVPTSSPTWTRAR